MKATSDPIPVAAQNSSEIKPPSPFALAFFHFYVRFKLGWTFRSLRVAHMDRFPTPPDKHPIIVFLNHASWWDPIPCTVLNHRMRPHTTLYAPVDRIAMVQSNVSLIRRVGYFPIDTGTVRGTKAFLNDCKKVLDLPNAILWVTPQGEFTDPRSRPIHLRRGLATLIARLGPVTVVPLALEYSFWEHSRPFVLGSWGEPIHIEDGASKSIREWHQLLTQSLTATQDELADLVIRREGNAFRTICFGRLGPRNALNLIRDLKPLFQRTKEPPAAS
jgi:1-acyl-sn-glycerol-3-phosphate acyltransferase